MELARVMRRRTVREGEILWRQGDDGAGDGVRRRRRRLGFAARARRSRGGDRAGRSGGDGRRDRAARRRGAHDERAGDRDRDGARARPAGLRGAARPPASRRRSSSSAASRRSSPRAFATSSGTSPPRSAARRPARRPATPARALADLEHCGPPDSRYVRRMATFHDFDPLALWGFLTSGSYVRCPPGRTLLAEGAPSTAYYLTINGAVEKVLVRGDRRIRVGLAGPGEGVRLREPHRRRPVPRHRDHARAGAAARPAARPVRAALQRGGRRLPRLPRRDPARPAGHVAPDAAPARAPRLTA